MMLRPRRGARPASASPRPLLNEGPRAAAVRPVSLHRLGCHRGTRVNRRASYWKPHDAAGARQRHSFFFRQSVLVFFAERLRISTAADIYPVLALPERLAHRVGAGGGDLK